MAAGRNPHALLVDAMGTLLALRPPAPVLRRLLHERFGVTVGPDDAARALRAEIAYYRGHLHEGRDEAALRQLRLRCAEVLRAALGEPAGLAAVTPEAMTELLLESLHFDPFDDAAPALREARGRGERVVAVSNWDASLPEVLERVGLAPLLDGVVSSAAVGAAKPDPAIFAAALALAGVKPGAALHVGDSVREDVAGARAAGVEAVLIRRDGGPGPVGVRTISTLAELGPVRSRGRGWREDARERAPGRGPSPNL